MLLPLNAVTHPPGLIGGCLAGILFGVFGVAVCWREVKYFLGGHRPPGSHGGPSGRWVWTPDPGSHGAPDHSAPGHGAAAPKAVGSEAPQLPLPSTVHGVPPAYAAQVADWASPAGGQPRQEAAVPRGCGACGTPACTCPVVRLNPLRGLPGGV